MKKTLEISEEVEKHLAQIMHMALKTSGMDILASIDFVRNAIQMQPEPPKPPGT